MARELVIFGGSGAPAVEGAAGLSGGLFLLCMIVFSLSVFSMVIFACGDNDNSGKPRPGGGGAAAGAMGCWGGGGGCGGGGCGGGGGGGGCGGGGGGC